MINKYISDLVSGNNRIIIPDFGAFMIQDTPEGKVISFNDFLKFNDGLLVNHIIKSEKVNKNQALDQIKEYVRQIEATFARNQAYLIEGLGKLSKDSQGNIKFLAKGSAKTEPKAPSADMPIVLDEKPAEPVKTEPVKSVAETKTEPVKPVSEPVADVPKTKVEKEPVVIPKAEPVKAAASGPTVKPAGASGSKSTVINQKPSVVIKTKKKNSVLNTVLLILACLVIIAAGVWAVLTYNLIDRFMPAREAVVVSTDTVVVAEIDSTMMVDTVPVPTETQPKVVDEQVIPGEKRYYLIAGSFKVQSNADKFQQKLSGKGFNSQIITRKNGFNAVSIKDFATKAEALDEWQTLKDEYPGTWILIK